MSTENCVHHSFRLPADFGFGSAQLPLSLSLSLGWYAQRHEFSANELDALVITFTCCTHLIVCMAARLIYMLEPHTVDGDDDVICRFRVLVLHSKCAI